MGGNRPKPLRELARRIEAREATVGVIGLGYVGLPLAVTIAEADFRVLGFDVDGKKVSSIRRRRSYVSSVAHDRLRAVVSSSGRTPRGRLWPTKSFDRLAECDAVLICVPTPLTRGREPDLSHVERTVREVARYARPGQLVVLESTTYPGTTEEIVAPVLESKGLVVGESLAIAFSPEREDPGNPEYSTGTIPKLVGGLTPRCGELACALYGSFIEEVVPVESAKIAEAAKLLENVFRAVNIALVNELKVLFERMEIDVWDVIDAAATKPFGFTPFYPGPGLGGHCIPVDPFYLAWRARQFGLTTRFIELAGEINTAMPEWVVERIARALEERKVLLPGADVLILGVAYKPNVDDLRESPALELIDLLQNRGARVVYNDPYVPTIRDRDLRRYGRVGLSSVSLTPDLLEKMDCVVIATSHRDYDWDEIVRHSRLVVDTRNATRDVTRGRDRIVKS